MKCKLVTFSPQLAPDCYRSSTVLKKVVAFADGENLVCRYQAMLKRGYVPKCGIQHELDSFVWHEQMTTWTVMDLTRVNYYTSVVGDHDRVAAVSARISNTVFTCMGAIGGGVARGQAHIIPHVHKKPSKTNKTKVVDVNITIDVMRAAMLMPLDAIYLMSGDGDYEPLVREVVRSTSKQVYVAAFSDGLSEPLKSCAEQFIDLDAVVFRGPLAVGEEIQYRENGIDHRAQVVRILDENTVDLSVYDSHGNIVHGVEKANIAADDAERLVDGKWWRR